MTDIDVAAEAKMRASEIVAGINHHTDIPVHVRGSIIVAMGLYLIGSVVTSYPTEEQQQTQMALFAARMDDVLRDLKADLKTRKEQEKTQTNTQPTEGD